MEDTPRRGILFAAEVKNLRTILRIQALLALGNILLGAVELISNKTSKQVSILILLF